MNVEEAVEYFGTGYNLCKQLGLRRQNLTNWRNDKHIPYVTQMRIEKLTHGYLKAEEWRDRKDE